MGESKCESCVECLLFVESNTATCFPDLSPASPDVALSHTKPSEVKRKAISTYLTFMSKSTHTNLMAKHGANCEATVTSVTRTPTSNSKHSVDASEQHCNWHNISDKCSRNGTRQWGKVRSSRPPKGQNQDCIPNLARSVYPTGLAKYFSLEVCAQWPDDLTADLKILVEKGRQLRTTVTTRGSKEN